MKELRKGALFLTRLALFIYPSLVLAQSTPYIPGSGTAGSATQEILSKIEGIIGFALAVVSILAVVVIVYAAFIFLFAGGDTEKAQTARRYITYVVVAVAVAALARLFVGIIIELVQ